MKLDYDEVVSICDAHGIGLPVDCVEMVVEIVKHVAAQPDRPRDGGERPNPVEPSALASSIAEVEALSHAEDHDLTVSEMESMMLVLLDLPPKATDGDDK